MNQLSENKKAGIVTDFKNIPIKKCGLFKTPMGFHASPLEFENNCLLIAISIGVIYHKLMTIKDKKKRNCELLKLYRINHINKNRKLHYLQNNPGNEIIKVALACK